MDEQALTYAGVGVDIEAADEAIRRLRPHARSTFRSEVLTDIGSFASMVAIPKGYNEPILVSGTDGIGTKGLVADACGRHDTVGVDLVAMCVDDIVTHGAEPLFFLDMITVGRVDAERIEQLVAGMANGCRQARCALTGGEIAEHPDAMKPEDWDLAGFAVGVVDRTSIIDGSAIVVDDVMVGIHSPGLRCNGYSLARQVLMSEPSAVHRPAWVGAEVTVGEELLRPSVIYAPAVLSLVESLTVHAMVHVTGGGLAANVGRVLPPEVDAVVDRASWPVPRIFGEIARRGAITPDEMSRVFNMGIGMVAFMGSDEVDQACELLDFGGHDSSVIGRVVSGSGQVHFDGS